ncbi:MAG: DUF1329 domain-containing protein [Deltaproteobacteria bacterium]|nr:DUF1329 domain-containing protein [Deltaproteobacteria bacterium]
MNFQSLFQSLSLFLIAVVSFAAEPPQSELGAKMFLSDETGARLHQEIQSGTTISQQNWQIAEQVLPQEILHVIQAGDFAITVQETTNFPLRPAYQAATETYAPQVKLDGGSRIEGYQGGRPFPLLEASDPQAGEKAAWNLRYRDMPKAFELRVTMQSVNNSGSITMQNLGRMQARYGLHRVGKEHDDPQWQERGEYMKATFQLLAPADLEGQVRIMTLHDDMALTHEELAYNPQNRRIRRSYANVLGLMGGGRYEVLMEEQPPFFFIGYVQAYHWTYKGEQALLLPGFLRAEHLTFGGKNDWYPNVAWELRHVVILEAVPKGAHPYGKRTFYLDAQTYAPLCTLGYNAQGEFVRLGLIVHGHPDFVPGSGGVQVPVPMGASWISFKLDRASQFIATRPTFKDDDSPRRYEMMELLRRGK